MPIDWTIDREKRFMFLRSSGDVSRAEVDELLDALVANDAFGFAKLFDGAAGWSTMSMDEMVQLGMRFRALHTDTEVGPLAMVMPLDRGDRMERLLGMIAAADRPMRVFTSLEKARAWLDEKRAKQP